jgi:hypothetical protein
MLSRILDDFENTYPDIAETLGLLKLLDDLRVLNALQEFVPEFEDKRVAG